MRLISILKTTITACLGLVALSGAAQSNHTVTFSGNASDFNAAEKYTAQGAGMNTDYYITYDATNIYIGAFRTSGSTFGGTDNLAVYIDTDPNATPTAGTGTTTGQNYNSVTGTLPFSANYVAHVEQSYQEMKTGTTWATAVTGFTVWTSTTAREITIPRSSIGNPDAVYITMWMGYGGGFFANAPGANIGASGNPTITGYVGGIGLYSADCIPINTINLPITASITNGVPAAAATYGRVIVTTGTVTNANSWTLAPGGAISVSGGTFAIGTQTITMGSATTANGKGTTINTSGAGAITTTATSVIDFGGEGYVTGNNLGLTANVRIRNKFTGLASGGLTINSGGSLDIRAGGFVSANPPTYAAGSNLKYNTGVAYSASIEWTSNAASGVGVPSNVVIGDLVTATTLNFGASTVYRRLTGNLSLSASNTIALSTAVGGDLKIGGNWTNAGTFTPNARAVYFDGTAAQTINATATGFAYLFISNTTANVTAAAAITVANNVTVDANARLDMAANTLTLSTGSTGTINGFLRSAGTITTTGALTFTSTGTYEHNFTTTAGVIPTATWTAGSTCSIIGYTSNTTAPTGLGQSFSNFTFNTPGLGGSFALSSALTTVNGTLSIISTGTPTVRELRLATSNGTALTANYANVNISGGTLTLIGSGTAGTNTTTINTSGNVTISGGTIEFNSGSNAGSATWNIAGNFSQSGGAIQKTNSAASVVNFNKATGTQIFTQSAGTISGNNTWNVGTGVTTNIVQLGSNVALGTGTGTFTVANNGTLDFQTFVLTGSGTFAAATGSTLQTAHLSGIFSSTAAGSVQTTTRTFTNTGVNYIYNGAAAQVTGTAIAAAASIANLTINNSSNVTLSASVPSLTGVLTFTNGKLSLSTFDLVMGSSATVSGASSSAYVLTGSTGQMKRSALGAAFTFPVGNSAYNPLTLTNAGTADVYGVRVVDGAVANANTAALAVNRAWVLTEAVAGGSTLSAVAQYNTGEEGASFAGGTTPYIGFWNNASPWTQVGATLAGSNPFTATSSSTFAPADLTTGTKYIAIGKDAAFVAPSTSYVWNGATSSDWGTGTNWTPNGVPGAVDNVTISVPGTNTLSINSARSITNFTVSGTGTFTTTSAGTLSISGTLVSSTSASVSLDCASTVSITSSTSQPIPAWNFGNLNTTGGARVLASSGTIGICGTFTPGAGALTITGSTVDFNGTGAQTVNAINYNNLTISGARGAATVTLTSGTIGVAGTFNPSATSVSYTNTGNTLDFNGTSTQTVAAFPSYNNLTISGARGAATVTLASGTIGVAGTFNPSATAVTYSSTSNTFDYTSASPQTITAFNRYENLSNSGNGARTLGAGTININGVYTPTTAAVTVGTGTVNFTNSASQPIPASFYYNITNTGNGDRVWANSGNIDVANVFIAGTGTHTITGSTVRYSSTGVGPYALSVINTNVAGSSYNNLIIAGSNAGPTVYNIAGATYGVAGNMTITGGHFYVASSFLPGTLNIYGNLSIAGGTLVLNSSPNTTDIGTVNLYGNYSMNTGTLARNSNTNPTNASLNFVKASGTQTFTHTAGVYSVSGGFGLNINIGDGTTTNTVQFLSGLNTSSVRLGVLNNATVDFGTNVYANGGFTLNSGATLITAHAQGIAATSGVVGSLQSMVPSLSTTANYVYNGTVAQATGTGLTGANNLTISNTSGATPAVTLTSSATVSNVLTLTSGIVQLGTNNLTISNAATSAISGASSTRYIQTNSTGELRRAINGGIGSSTTYTFPVGTGSDYSPANYTFTATGNAFTLHTRAVGSAHPSLNSSAFQSDYINRYWISNTSGTPSTYSYTNAFTYVAGDQVGSAASMYLNKWAGVWIQDATSSASGLVLSSGPTAFTESTNSLAATAEWTGRFEPIVTTYTWTGNVDNTWSNPNNWSPNTSVAGPVSTDNIIINAPGSVANLNITGSQSIASVTLNGTGSFSLASGASFTINGAVTYGGSFSASLNCNSTITYNNTAALTIPPFAYGNLANANASTRTWAAGATTGICGTLTTGTGSTFTAGAGSTVNYNGSGAQTIQPLSYANLTISNNRGAAVVTTPTGTISVSGTFDISTYATSTTPSATVASGSIFDFTGAGAQTIPAFYYGQLNNTGNGARTLASSGIVDIAQGFTPTTGTTTITGSTVRFSDVTAGTRNLSNFTSNVAGRQYNNLIFAGGASTIWQPASAFNLGVAGDLTLAGLEQVNMSPYATAVTWTIDGNVTINGGGTLSVAKGTAAAGTGTLNVTGNTTVSNGSLVISGTTAAASVVGTMTTNDLIISGTGSLNLDAASTSSTGSVTVNGNMTVTSTTANCVNLGSGTNNAGNVFNLKGNFSKSGTGNIGFTGTYGATSGFNFNGTGTQTYTHSGAATTGGFITVASGSTLQLLSNLTMGISTSPLTVIGTLDCGAFVAAASLSTNTFAITATGTIKTSNAGGISASISGFNNANTTWVAASTYVYSGSTQSTGLAGYANILSTNAYNMTWLGSTSLSLDKAVTLTNLNFTNAGYIQLGNFNMTITSAGAINGSSFSSTKMIVTDGTGTLLRGLNALVGIPFTWPIGELTGTAEYSPVTISNIASNSSATASIGFRVVDGVQSNMSPAVSYLSRYWNYTANTLTAGTSWSNATFTYDASDIVVGPEASLKVNAYDATTLAWTQFASSSAASNVLTFTSGATTTTLLSGNDITGRIDVPVYYRSVTSGTWANPSTWEISTDQTFTSPTGVGASVAPNAANSAGIEVLNGHTVTVGATTNADQVTINSGGTIDITTGTFTIANGTGTDLTVASGGTLQTSAAVTLVVSPSSAMQVNGTFKVTTAVPTITTSGVITIGATGTYQHNVNAGTIPTCTWTAGSTCLLKNMTATQPSGLAQAFSNFTVDCPTLGAGGLQFSGNLTTVNGNLTLVATGAGFVRLSTGAASYTLNVGGNIDVQAAELDFSSGGTNAVTATINLTGSLIQATGSTVRKTGAQNLALNITGDFTQNGGTFDFSTVGTTTSTVTLKGNFLENGIVQRGGGTAIFNFHKASGTQTWSQGTPITTAQAAQWNIGTGATTNTVQFLTDVNIGTSGANTFTVNNASTLDFQDKVLYGTNTPFTMGATATLKMGSPYGITNAAVGATSGNLQTQVAGRVVQATGTFIYNGTVNQVTGNLLPTTITGKLGVANTGTSGNNVVTLTTTPTTTAQLNLISGLFAAGAAGQLNISAAGTVNGTGGDFETGTNAGILNFPSTGTFTGSCNPYNVYTSGGVNFGTGTVTIQPNGTFRINVGGFVSTNAPFYASGSTLQYNTTGVYGRGLEWKASSGRAFPHHVRISNNTTLNPTANSNATFPESTGGDLTIDAGSALYNDYGGVNMALPLIVGGGVNLAGSLSLSGQIGSNCHLNGNWTNTGSGSNFFCNARSVKFLGSTNQNIGGTNTGSNPFDNIVVDNLAGVTLTGYDIYVNNTVLLTNGNLTLGNYNLTMASGAVVSNPSSTRFIVTNGTGQLIQYFAAISRQYPVGPNSTTYAPVTLKQNGTADNIGVRVVTAPAFAGTLNDATKMVNLQWLLNEATAGGNALTSTFEWPATSEAAAFDRTLAVFHGNYNGTAWQVRPSSATTGTDPYESLSTVDLTGTLSNTAFAIGNFEGFLPCLTTLAAGNWNNGAIWLGGSEPVAGSRACVLHSVVVTDDTNPMSGVTVSSSGTLTVNSGWDLNLDNNGLLVNNTGSTVSLGAGNVVFTGDGVVSGSNPFSLNNLELNGTVSFTTAPTVNGKLQMFSGAVVTTNAPVYTGSSILEYTSGTSITPTLEWSANGTTAGAGIPANVNVVNSTTVNMPTSNRGIAGSLNITSGTLNLNATSGDLYLTGNWTRGAAATFASNNRAVFFNGSANQTIAVTGGGTETFSYLLSNKTGGSLVLSNSPATNVNVSANTGNVFEMGTSNTLDVNGQTFSLTGTGGNFNITGGAVTVTGVSGSLFAISNGTKTVSHSGGATLGFGTNVKVALNSGMNFGSNISTINGTLQIALGGFVTGNAPFYGSASTLHYFTGNYYNRGIEWSTASGAGYPNHVMVSQNGTVTTVDLSPGAAACQIAGDLTINDGAVVTMGSMSNPLIVLGSATIGNGTSGTLTLSSNTGGDAKFAGNLTVNTSATLTQNSREVEMNGTAVQNIYGVSTFDYLSINNSGASVKINSAANINNRIRLVNGLFDVNGYSCTMANNSKVVRLNGTISTSPIVSSGDMYDMEYQASVTSSVEFNSANNVIRDLIITSGNTLTLGANRTFNRDLTLSGGDLNLGTFTLTGRGRVTAPSFSGSINVSGGGTRTITGSTGAQFDITGLGANLPNDYTKTVSTFGGTLLSFDANVLVRIGDGSVDFGAGSPTTINGTLQVLLGGSVGQILNPCYYGVNSLLRFANTVDYQVGANDKTWASGSISSGNPGIPYNVEILDAGTDLQLQDTRALRGNLTMTNGTFTLTPAYSGSFNIGGNWTRTGVSSAFTHNNKKVVFDRQSAGDQTITVGSGVITEIFYDLEVSTLSGNLVYGSSTSVAVRNNLNFVSGNVNLNGANYLTIGSFSSDGTITGVTSSRYVIGSGGTVRRYTGNNSTNYDFPLGDATNYSPFQLNLTNGGQSGAYIDAVLYNTVHPNMNLLTTTDRINRYWKIEPSGLAASPVYNVVYSYAASDVVGTSTNFRPVKYSTTNPGNGWLSDPGSSAPYVDGTAGSHNAGTRTFTWSGITTFSEFSGAGNGSPLPIELLSFNATAATNSVVLDWVTTSEINNATFHLERSIDLENIETIGQVAGAGNSNTTLNYNFIDSAPKMGVSYYRLRQTDFNGAVDYSEWAPVVFSNNSTSLNYGYFYSNKGENSLSFGITNTAPVSSLEVIDATGRVVLTEVFETRNSTTAKTLTMPELANGVYFLRVISGGQHVIRKFGW